jgi:hypothetical protein
MHEHLINSTVNNLVDFCAGREQQPDDVGAVARFIAAHSPERPAQGKPSRWPDIDALKTAARHFGPPVTMTQIDAAVAAAHA